MKIQQYQLEKIKTHGRIWRLRYDGTAEVPGTPVGPAASRPIPAVPATPAIALDFTAPRMYAATSAQLVANLRHPNGWWRDTAQRQLVLKQDKSVVPALQEIVRRSGLRDDRGDPISLYGRFHALWTLEGLGALDPALVREVMKDPNPRMRVQAIRASETLFKAGNKSFDADYRQAATDTDPDVAIQAMMTLRVLRVADAQAVITSTMANNKARGVQELGRLALASAAPGAPAPAGGRGGPVLAPDMQLLMDRGQAIYTEICFSCHGEDGRGTPKADGQPGETMAPPLAGSAHVQGHRDFVIKTILHGLTGENNGRTYSEVMIPMKQDDNWIASVGSYVRNSFGNSASFITPSDVARVRAMTATRKTQWTVAEINATLPIVLETQSAWTLSASHNSASATRALTTQGWTSGAAPAAGMWFQVELPQPVQLTEIQYTAPAGRGAGPGARAGGPPPAGGPATPGATPPANTPATPGAPAAPTRGGRAMAPLPELQVQVSLDGKTWSQPMGGASSSTLTILSFVPTRAKLVRIVRNAPPAQPAQNWAIQTLRLYEMRAPAPSAR
jgi:mono/diheme cytochrome c family protein